MSLHRKFLRREVVALLVGKTIALDRVVTNRGNSVWEDEVPALTVYARREDIEKRNVSPIKYKRSLRIAVELYVGEEKGKDISDQVDDLCEQVERALLPAMMLPGTPDELELDSQGTGLEQVEIDVDAEGKKLLGAARLTFVWVYYTTVDELDAEHAEVLGEFDRAFLQWDFPPPDGAPEATDDIIIP